MIDVSLLAAADLTWAMARHLIDREAPGHVVNVGSRGAFRGEPEYPAYGASKAALHAFGQSMAAALAPHRISVTAVAPGFIATERQTPQLAGPRGDELRSQSPFGRVGTPEKVAAAVHYLASSETTSGAVRRTAAWRAAGRVRPDGRSPGRKALPARLCQVRDETADRL
ncbi:SDR family oxidoreductase [Streptomyces sp. NPDC021356]|uniref:SDR family NAD(P)-dependent oxidoreductase n=1 Tax=Streptomyces sp. NPDC021356 TaxID=3154900 RepID=UPI0033D7B1F3